MNNEKKKIALMMTVKATAEELDKIDDILACAGQDKAYWIKAKTETQKKLVKQLDDLAWFE